MTGEHAVRQDPAHVSTSISLNRSQTSSIFRSDPAIACEMVDMAGSPILEIALTLGQSEILCHVTKAADGDFNRLDQKRGITVPVQRDIAPSDVGQILASLGEIPKRATSRGFFP